PRGGPARDGPRRGRRRGAGRARLRVVPAEQAQRVGGVPGAGPPLRARALLPAPVGLVLSPETFGRTLAEAPDPHLARLQLSRVGEHAVARELLARPDVLPNAARVLGFSRSAAD